MGTRREFSPRFKAEAVQFVIESGRPVAQVARELQINEGTLGNWVQAWRSQRPEVEQSLSPVERQRVSEMQAEVLQLRMENESLRERWPSSLGRLSSAGVRADR